MAAAQKTVRGVVLHASVHKHGIDLTHAKPDGSGHCIHMTRNARKSSARTGKVGYPGQTNPMRVSYVNVNNRQAKQGAQAAAGGCAICGVGVTRRAMGKHGAKQHH